MKKYLLVASLLIGSALAQPSFMPMNDPDLGVLRKQNFTGLHLGEEMLERGLIAGRLKEQQTLQYAKFHLLNGEITKARQELDKLLRTDSKKLEPILLRYTAIAEFLEGDWRASLRTLSDERLNLAPFYGKICVMKVMALVAVKETKSIGSEWKRCKVDNAQEILLGDVSWMDVMVQLAQGAPPGTAAAIFVKRPLYNLPNDSLKRMLKLALFLNQEALIESQLEGLDYSVVEDEELRAIMAHIYFRNGKFARAWKFMEDLSNPNVENMKGNLWLLRKNNEIAYAQFKLALKQKSNSHNAAERALPLAWSLKQWQEGMKLSERMYIYEGNINQQLTLASAFAVQLGKWDLAQQNLQRVNQSMGENTAHEVEQLLTYVALRRRDQRSLKKHGKRSCEIGDMIACWMLTANLNWESLATVVAREDKVEAYPPIWRELASGDVPAFEDAPMVDQRDIDELDDALIQLVK